jgi:serine/threonine protein kinase
LWRAHQLTLDRTVLILELKPELSDIPESRAIAFNSVRLLTELGLPLFPDVIDLLHQGSTDYIILEDANISSVLSVLNGNRLNAEQLITLAQQLAEHFCALQKKGLVYRTCSPATLFITEDATPILPDVTSVIFGVDFRYVSRFQPRHINDLTWASPEEHEPQTIALDTRADIFSIGLTLYALATGQIPFGMLAPEEIPEAKKRRAIPSPCDISSQFPKALAVVLAKMTHRDPAFRHQNWEEVLADLALVQAGATPQIEAPEYALIAAPAPKSVPKAGRTIRISAKALRVYRAKIKRKRARYLKLITSILIFIALALGACLLWKLFL